MLVILKHDPNPAQLESLVSWLEEKGVSVHTTHGHINSILGLSNN